MVTVICNVSYINVSLTEGKEYQVLDVLGVFYILKDDDGVIKGYPRSHFEKEKKGFERLLLEAPDVSSDEFEEWLAQLPPDDVEEILRATDDISRKAVKVVITNKWK